MKLVITEQIVNVRTYSCDFIDMYGQSV